MASKFYFFVNHPAGREYFAEDEIKKANLFAQRLAIETGKVVARRDIRGGEYWFYPISPSYGH